MVREKSLFIGPLNGAYVPLALEAFLTLHADWVIFIYVPTATEGLRTQEREREFWDIMTYKRINMCLHMYARLFLKPP